MELCLRLPDAEHETFFSFRYSTVLEQEAIPSRNSEKLKKELLMFKLEKKVHFFCTVFCHSFGHSSSKNDEDLVHFHGVLPVLLSFIMNF